MDKNNREWKNLSLEEKAKLMSVYVKYGYNNVADIQKDYDANYAHYMEANPDFMQRLRDNDTTSVANSDGSRSTHKLGYVTNDNGAVLYPAVQREKDGALKDHTGEPLNGYRSAEEKGDTINVSTPSAIWLSENYKKDFPKYFEKFINKFEEGGPIPSNENKEEDGEEYNLGNLDAAYTSTKLSRNDWNKLYANGKVSLNEVPKQYRSWIEGENSELKHRVTNAIDNTGKQIFNAIDTATAFMPGPVGTLNWLAHMGVNGVQGKWGNVALDLGMAGVMAGVGEGLKALSDSSAVKNLKDKAITAFIDAYPNSKLASKRNYLTIPNDGRTTNAFRVTSLSNNRFKLTGFNLDHDCRTAKKIGDRIINVPSNIPEEFAKKDVEKLASEYLFGYGLDQKRLNDVASWINRDVYKHSKNLQSLGYDKKTLDRMVSASSKIPNNKYTFNADKFATIFTKSTVYQSPVIDEELSDYVKFPKVYRDLTRILGTRTAPRGFKSYPYLKEILRESPQYSDRAKSLLEKGLSEEDVVKRLLQDRFTFTRGVGVAKVPEVEAQLFTIPKTKVGGRADADVFPDLNFKNEDVLYTSNSIPTAYAYSYPSAAKNSRVGVWYRDPVSFDLTGTPLDWWQNPNNRLPLDIVRTAPSTVSGWETNKILGWLHSNDIYRAWQIDPYMASQIMALAAPGKGMHHYLFRGKRGDEMPLPNMKLKIFDTTGKKAEDLPGIFGDFISDLDVEGIKNSVTRQHRGEPTPGFSLGNALGGPLRKGISAKANQSAYSVFAEGGSLLAQNTPEEQPTAPYEWTDKDTRDYIQAFESFSDKAYDDGKGNITAGWGHKLSDAELKKYWNSETGEPIGKIPKEITDRWWAEDFSDAAYTVDEVYADEDLPSWMIAALTSMAFNGGKGFIAGYKGDDGVVRGFPKMEAAIRAYSKNKTKENLAAIIAQMQYKDDNLPGLGGLSNRYGLTRAVMEGIIDPTKVKEYINSKKYSLYGSDKKTKKK